MKRSVPIVAALLVFALAAPASAQRVPGYRSDADAATAQFLAYALEGFQEVVAEWVTAVNAHDAERAASLYTADASTYLDGAANARTVDDALEGWLTGVEEVRLGLSDFDASGRISYGSMNVQLYAIGEDRPQTGTLTFVMRRHGGDWRIRAQTLVLF